jgi:hypothetical protein
MPTRKNRFPISGQFFAVTHVMPFVVQLLPWSRMIASVFLPRFQPFGARRKRHIRFEESPFTIFPAFGFASGTKSSIRTASHFSSLDPTRPKRRSPFFVISSQASPDQRIRRHRRETRRPRTSPSTSPRPSEP